MKKIKVIHIIWSASLGGISRVVYDLVSEQLQSLKVEPAVLIAKSTGEMLKDFKSLTVTYEPAIKNGLNFNFKKLGELKNIFKKYDILHFHTYNPLIATAAVQSGKKIIYSEHGNFAFERKISFGENIARQLLKSFLNKRVDYIIFNSYFTSDESLKRYKLRNKEYKIIYNGIKNFTPQHSKTSAHFTICSAGRMVEVKCFDRLLKCIEMIADPSIRVIIAGEGPLKPELQKKVVEYKIEKQVNLPGYADIHELIAGSDLCIFPFRNEAFGLVAIEAYQEGKPVLVFNDGGGITELVMQVEPHHVMNSLQQMCEKIKEYRENPELLKNDKDIIKRKEFASGFSISKMSSEILKVYSQI